MEVPMSYVVTLDVYSGRENPRIVLDHEAGKKLEGFIRDTPKAFQRPDAACLGYRGFLVEPIAADTGALAFLPKAKPGVGPRLRLGGQVDAEAFLLDKMQPHLTKVVSTHVRDKLAADWWKKITTDLRVCPPSVAVDAPTYEPAFWNVPARQPKNNCYNYANNQATNTFAQPGRATGHMYTAINCDQVSAGATSDGLTACGGFADALAAGSGWYVGLVIWPGHDYHWYRQDACGCWSHKPGQTAARNTDNAGATISDPQACDRGPYTVFCSYMRTNGTVHIA
jgi:hypothetical protein